MGGEWRDAEVIGSACDTTFRGETADGLWSVRMRANDEIRARCREAHAGLRGNGARKWGKMAAQTAAPDCFWVGGGAGFGSGGLAGGLPGAGTAIGVKL